MTIFKIVLFSLGLVVSIVLIIKEMKTKGIKPKIYSFLLPILFLMLIIKNIREL